MNELDETSEAIAQELESAANYMRGMAFDPRIPSDVRAALIERANRIDNFLEPLVG